jgi:hypothetical protein
VLLDLASFIDRAGERRARQEARQARRARAPRLDARARFAIEDAATRAAIELLSGKNTSLVSSRIRIARAPKDLDREGRQRVYLPIEASASI